MGAGTGQDSVFFAGEGLDVTAVDLSPAMIERVRAKGLRGLRAVTCANWGSPQASFDAVYAFNSLLHVPNGDLADSAAAVRAVLTPGGLSSWASTAAPRPRRGSRTTAGSSPSAPTTTSSTYAKEQFDILDFHAVHEKGLRFQSLTLVKP